MGRILRRGKRHDKDSDLHGNPCSEMFSWRGRDDSNNNKNRIRIKEENMLIIFSITKDYEKRTLKRKRSSSMHVFKTTVTGRNSRKLICGAWSTQSSENYREYPNLLHQQPRCVQKGSQKFPALARHFCRTKNNKLVFSLARTLFSCDLCRGYCARKVFPAMSFFRYLNILMSPITP